MRWPRAGSSRRGRCAARCICSRPRRPGVPVADGRGAVRGSGPAGSATSACPRRLGPLRPVVREALAARRSRGRSWWRRSCRPPGLEHLGDALAVGLGHAPEAARLAGRPLLRPEPRQPGDVHASGGRELPLGGPPRPGGGRAPSRSRLLQGLRSGDARQLPQLAGARLDRSATHAGLVRRARGPAGGGGRGRRNARWCSRRTSTSCLAETVQRRAAACPVSTSTCWVRAPRTCASWPASRRSRGQQAERLDRAGGDRGRRRCAGTWELDGDVARIAWFKEAGNHRRATPWRQRSPGCP